MCFLDVNSILYMWFSVEFEEMLYLQGFDGIFGVKMVIFLMVWKVVKCLILVGFIEVGIEVILVIFDSEMSRKCWFYKEFVDWTDVPVYMANKRSKNVNYAPILTEKYTVIVQYYSIF